MAWASTMPIRWCTRRRPATMATTRCWRPSRHRSADPSRRRSMQAQSTTILINGKFATLDREQPRANAVAIRDGRFLAVGDTEHVMRFREAGSQVIDLNGRSVIPGLNDSHLHLIRGGLN